MKSRAEDIALALRQQGVRVTNARRLTYEILQEAAEPLSVAQIAALLQHDGTSIDLVTVYRTLETLERCGLVARIDRLNDGWRYATRAKEHHHIIVCSECGGTSPLDVCDLNRIEKNVERSTGFTNIFHSLQFFGTCPDCSR